jgi:hypothetical protein
MSTIFSFQQGSESSRVRYNTDSSPLLGRFRAVPRRDSITPRRSSGQLGLLSAGFRGSVHVGYGALLAAELADEEQQEQSGSDEDDYDGYDGAFGSALRLGRRFVRRMEDTWITPRAIVVKRLVDVWWTRWTVLVILPALLVSLRDVVRDSHC